MMEKLAHAYHQYDIGTVEEHEIEILIKRVGRKSLEKTGTRFKIYIIVEKIKLMTKA